MPDGTTSLIQASWDLTKTVVVAFLGLFGITIKRLHTRMDKIDSRMDNHAERVEKKIDHLTTRIDKLIDGKK